MARHVEYPAMFWLSWLLPEAHRVCDVDGAGLRFFPWMDVPDDVEWIVNGATAEGADILIGGFVPDLSRVRKKPGHVIATAVRPGVQEPGYEVVEEWETAEPGVCGVYLRRCGRPERPPQARAPAPQSS